LVAVLDIAVLNADAARAEAVSGKTRRPRDAIIKQTKRVSPASMDLPIAERKALLASPPAFLRPAILIAAEPHCFRSLLQCMNSKPFIAQLE